MNLNEAKQILEDNNYVIESEDSFGSKGKPYNKYQNDLYDYFEEVSEALQSDEFGFDEDIASNIMNEELAEEIAEEYMNKEKDPMECAKEICKGLIELHYGA